MRCALRSTGDIPLQSAQLAISVQTRQLKIPLRSSVFVKLLSFPRGCTRGTLEIHHRELSEHYS
ncbi:hypothetical protein [Rubritalea tangerina]|uniref:hypothetical protein n=1 Tax=Rubritalea tangerina TaxID=430798 RepID=UPI003612A553